MSLLTTLGEQVSKISDGFDGSIAETDGQEYANKQANEELAHYLIMYLVESISLEEALTSDSKAVQALAKKWSNHV